MYALRTNINVAIGAMVKNHTVFKDGKEIEKVGKIKWLLNSFKSIQRCWVCWEVLNKLAERIQFLATYTCQQVGVESNLTSRVVTN